MSARAPEEELLIACARLHMDGARRARARSIVDTGVDWTLALAKASQQGLRPLLYRHLSSIEDAVPRNVIEELWVTHERRVRRNRAMAAELAAITGHLESDGIASVAYKGPTLAMQAFGDLALREFADLDVIVRPSEVAAARRSLASSGYRMLRPLTDDQEEALISSDMHYELPLLHEERGHTLELHWRTDPVVAFLPIEEDAWWRSRPTIQCAGRDIKVLAPDELLLALCLHGTRHCWSHLAWLVDVAELLRTARITDVDAVVANAYSHDCVRRTALGPLVAHELLNAPIPDSLARLAADLPVAKSAAITVRHIFDPEPPGMWSYVASNLRLRDTTAQRVSYAWKAAMVPGWGEWQRWRLPRRFFFLYWLLRPLRLAAKYLFSFRSLQSPAAATPRTPPPQPRSTG